MITLRQFISAIPEQVVEVIPEPTFVIRFVPNSIPINKLMVELETDCITRALTMTNGRISKAAMILGIGRTTLVAKMIKHAINKVDFFPENQS